MSPLWWDSCAERSLAEAAGVTPSVARAVMTGSPEQLFASLEVDGAVIAVARVAFAQAWAGVTAMLVSPGHRRAGVAVQLMAAMADASRERGIRSMHLQVVRANSAARSLYERLGFSVHHEYVYLGS
jgi:predicted GNAT family acetyltransferase